MKPQVSVLYVNYNTQKLLEDSIQSLRDLKDITYEVIVVDNGSKQFSEAAINKILPNATILQSKKNLGFGKANNLAAKNAKGEYLWLLNSDTLVQDKNSLSKLVKFLDTHLHYGAVAPLLVNEQGDVQQAQIAYLPSVSRTLAEKLASALSKVVPSPSKALKRLSLEEGGFVSQDVPQAVAAALLIRRSVFEQVGGFSPEYFMYYEDTDLCKKIQGTNHKIRFLPSAKIVHLHGKSTTGTAKRKKYYYDSQDIYYRKWHRAPSHLALRLLRWPSKVYYGVRGERND